MSKVFFEKKSISRLVDGSKILEKIKEGDIVAVKLHWGEEGNETHISPKYAKVVVDKVKELGGLPFVTDTTSLYNGPRCNAVNSLEVARKHGFTDEKLGCPVIVADGIRGFNGIKIKIQGHELSEIEVAQGIYEADFLIGLAHVKGHMMAGFGGAVKNIAMGCVTKNSKRDQHMVNLPRWISENCVYCYKCVDACKYRALKFDKNKKFKIDRNKCFACFGCTFACPNDALKLLDEGKVRLQHRLADTCSGVMKKFKNNSVFINCAVNITRECDCCDSENPVVMPDIGFFASDDIVSVDAASLDFMNRYKSFMEIHGVDPKIQINAAEDLGLGTSDYELIEI